MGRIINRALLILAAGGVLTTAQDTPTFRSDVRLVRLFVTVKDPGGAPVSSLKNSDFRVFDSGVEQKITVFERETELPLSISVLVDTSGSTAKELKSEVDSVERFLRALLKEGNPDDRASLYSFNWQVILERGFTRRLDLLENGLKHLKAEGGTSMYDAIYLAAQNLEERQGRKAMVMVTDGGDTTSNKSFHQALEAAHLAEAVLYPIVIVPITNDAGRNIGGENALTTLATGTGGRVFAPTVGQELDDAFSEILRDLRTQYLVGYYPTDLPPSKDRFRRVKVQVNRPGLRVSTRAGYYEDSEQPRSSRPRAFTTTHASQTDSEEQGPGRDVHGAEVSAAAHRPRNTSSSEAQR